MSNVSVLKTSPKTILDDYQKLMDLADYKSAVPKDNATILKILDMVLLHSFMVLKIYGDLPDKYTVYITSIHFLTIMTTKIFSSV